MHSPAPGPVHDSPGPAPPSPTQLESQARHSSPSAYSPLAHLSGWGHAIAVSSGGGGGIGQVVHSSALGPVHASQLAWQLSQAMGEGDGEAVASGAQCSQPVFGPALSHLLNRAQCEFPGAQVISVHRSLLSQRALHSANGAN